MKDVAVACSAVLLAWVVIFAAAIVRGGAAAGRPVLVSAALLTLSSAGTMMAAFWLRTQRGVQGLGATRHVVEGFLLMFVVLGAVAAWSAPLRPDVFRAAYVLVLLVSMSVIRGPGRPIRRGMPVRLVSAWVFGAVAVAHLVRLLTGTPVSIGWWSVPEWISVVAVFAAAALALWNAR